jgi:hypothetical protein
MQNQSGIGYSIISHLQSGVEPSTETSCALLNTPQAMSNVQHNYGVMNRRHKILWNQTADIIQHPMK